MESLTTLPDIEVYRLLVQQTRDYALFVLDPTGRIMTWNIGAEQTKGYRAEEIIGRHFSIFYTRDAVDRKWPEHELHVAAREGHFEDEGWRVRKDGSRFWANVVITALRDEDGHLLGYSKITRDMTTRKTHEDMLRQSQERFRLLVEGVVDYAIYMLDPAGLITSWNTGAERIKGYRRDEVTGKHFSRFYTPEDVAANMPWEELATARREGRVETEGWRVRKSGERFWARVIVTALHDEEGHLRGFAKVTQDMTDRRHLLELETASRNLSEFIAVLAHELRNPLAPIRNAVQVMASAPPDDPVQSTMRETIDRQSAQLARIVDDLLDIARITRNNLAMADDPLDLRDVVRQAVETAAVSLEAGQQRVELDLPVTPVMVRGDVHRLAQLVSNLLINSARYTPASGRVTVYARAVDGRAELRVTDTGCGIAPDLIERVFDMFVRGHTTPDRMTGGLGVGLALARRIGELHGGSLQAYSAGTGRGSEFTLCLPLVNQGVTAAEPVRPTVAPAPKPESRRVLVADDNVDAALTLVHILKALGHETSVVHDGADAVTMAVEFRPDVVLLDIGMPGLDGYEVARRLRASSTNDTMRIVAVTGWGQDSDRKKTQAAGFDMHLVKPVDITELARAIAAPAGALH